MENYVVIDLGSNSVRLRITNIADDGTLTVTHQLKEYVRLSENMGQEKTLKQEPIKRTLQALKSFKDIYSKLENQTSMPSQLLPFARQPIRKIS